MKYPNIIKIAAITTLLGSCLGSISAQNTAPDYETTATWIQSKFGQLGASTTAPSGASKNIRYSFVSMNNCTLLFSLDSTIMDDKGVLLNYSKVTYTIPLGSVGHVSFATGPGDGASQRDVNIEGGTNAFVLKTEKFVDNTKPVETKAQAKAEKVAAAKKLKAEKDLVLDPEPLDVTTRTNFAFIQLDRGDVNNLDLAPRLATALTRAVSICKAQAPKNAEPF
jgi:hypothetical protein